MRLGVGEGEFPSRSEIDVPFAYARLSQNVRMRHVHREGLKETWETFRKVSCFHSRSAILHALRLVSACTQYGRWEPAVNLLFPSYAQGLLGPSKSISSLEYIQGTGGGVEDDRKVDKKVDKKVI